MRPGVRRRGGPSCVFYSVRHGVSERRQKKVQVGLARVRRTLLCGQGRVWFRYANRATTCDDCAPRRDQARVEEKVFETRATISRLRAATSCSAGSSTRHLVARSEGRG